MFVYGFDGKFIAQVGRKGRGRGEYYNISDFDIDQQGRVHIIDGTSDQLLLFSSDFEHIKTTKLPYEVNVIKCLPNGNYIFNLSAWNTKEHEGCKIVAADSLFNTISAVGEYSDNIDVNVWLSYSNFVETAEGIYFHKPIEDSVMVYNYAGKVVKRLYFDFGEYAYPESKKSDVMTFMTQGGGAHTQTIMRFPTCFGRYVCGVLFDKNSTVSFIADREYRVLYKEAVHKQEKSLGNIVGVQNDMIITHFPPDIDARGGNKIVIYDL